MAPNGTGLPYSLTPRELEVVRCICDGMSNRDISRHFGISEETVKRHMSSLCDKTGQSSRLEVAIFAFRNGLAVVNVSLECSPVLEKIEHVYARIERDINLSRTLMRQLAAASQKEQTS